MIEKVSIFFEIKQNIVFRKKACSREQRNVLQDMVLRDNIINYIQWYNSRVDMVI